MLVASHRCNAGQPEVTNAASKLYMPLHGMIAYDLPALYILAENNINAQPTNFVTLVPPVWHST